MKKLVVSIMPIEIIIWGEWGRENYILEELAKRNKIKYGFMDYGWIPGTYRYYKDNIAVLNQHKSDAKNQENNPIDCIVSYIKNSGLDSSRFINTEIDNEELGKLDFSKKTIFFVGMDDYGRAIDPDSVFYKNTISYIVKGTKDALEKLALICKDNNWNLIFKPHPNGKEKYIGNVPENVTLVLYKNIDEMISMSDVVVSIMSAVDYKVLMFGKPLVSLGIATLNNQDCSYVVKSCDEIEEKMKSAIKFGYTKEQNTNFYRHLNELLNYNLWDNLAEREIRYGLSVNVDFY